MGDTRRASKVKMAANPAGFQFIVSTSSRRPDKGDRKLIKSHIIRGRHKAKTPRELPAWLSSTDALTTGDNVCHALSAASVPKRVGSDLSLVQFPEFMKPYMLQDIVKCKHTLLFQIEPFGPLSNM